MSTDTLNTGIGVDIATLSMLCHVESDVVEDIVRQYEENGAEVTTEQLQHVLSNERNRAKLFRRVAQMRGRSVEGLPETCAPIENFATYLTGGTTSAGFFEVVGDNVAENVSKDTWLSWKRRAIDSGCAKTFVEAVIQEKPAVTSYEEFIQYVADYADKTNAEDAYLAKIAARDLEKLRRDDCPAKTLADAIRRTYNTTAVTTEELCEELRDCKELRLHIYDNIIFSLIIQIEASFVAEGVRNCLERWATSPVVQSIVDQYLASLGVTQDDYEENFQALIDALPDMYRNEDSPDVWKAYKSVEIIKQNTHGEDYDCTKDVFDNDEDASEFCARTQVYVDNGVPQQAAVAQASEDVLAMQDEDVRSGLNPEEFFMKAASLAGRAVQYRYNISDNMERTFRESLGDYADVYDANRERAAAKRAAMAESAKSTIGNLRNKVSRVSLDKSDYGDVADSEENIGLSVKEEARMKRAEYKRQEALNREELAHQERIERDEMNKQARLDRYQEKLDNRGQSRMRNDPRMRNNTGYGNSGYGMNGYGGYNSYGGYNQRGGMFGRRGGMGGYGGYSGYGGYGRGGNFAPRIPTIVIAILINLVIGLLFWVMFKGVKASFATVGLIIATFGFARKQMREPNAIPMIIVGYILVVLAPVIFRG